MDPTLGKDSIRSGINAAIYGTLAVSVFMLVYYLVAGLVANIALMANIIILLGVMCSIGTTLTLPGIAGIVLTDRHGGGRQRPDLRAHSRGERPRANRCAAPSPPATPGPSAPSSTRTSRR